MGRNNSESSRGYSGNTGGTRSGQTWKKPKDLSVREREECGCGEGGGLYVVYMCERGGRGWLTGCTVFVWRHEQFWVMSSWPSFFIVGPWRTRNEEIWLLTNPLESEDIYSGISSEHRWTKNLMITTFPNTISSGKILYRYLFFSYPVLPGHLSLCTDTHFHRPLLVYSGKNVQRVKRKSTETSLIIKLYVFHKHPVCLPLTTCTSPSTITRIVKTHFYTTRILW